MHLVAVEVSRTYVMDQNSMPSSPQRFGFFVSLSPIADVSMSGRRQFMDIKKLKTLQYHKTVPSSPVEW